MISPVDAGDVQAMDVPSLTQDVPKTVYLAITSLVFFIFVNSLSFVAVESLSTPMCVECLD